MGLTWYSDSGASSTTTTATVNSEIYAKLTFKEADVRAVYVDWDDGVSNKKDEANYQWVQTTQPVESIVVPHTYNKSGNFKPIVQTINSQGYASRYYGEESSNSDIVPFSTLSTVSGMAVSDTTATGILRIENTTVKSGIDNSVFNNGPKLIYLQVAPTLNSTELNYAGNIIIETTALVATPSVDYTLPAGVAAGYSTDVQTVSTTLTTPTGSTGLTNIDFNGSVLKVLSVKYKNPKIVGTEVNDYTRNHALNYLKIFVVTVDDSSILPISYVSAGMPVKKASDNQRYLVADFSQSRAAASNITNKYYYYDNGKGIFKEQDRWALSSNKFTSATQETTSTKEISYTYSPRISGIGGYASTGATGEFTHPFGTGSTDTNAKWIYTGTTGSPDATTIRRTNQFALDNYGRFYDTYHLVRNSVEPSSSASNTSSIITNKPTVVRITPTIAPTTNNTLEKTTKFDATALTTASGNYTTPYTDEAENNKTYSATAADNGLISLSGANSQSSNAGATMGDLAGVNREANEYIFTLWDSKTNKVFLQCTPYWDGSAQRIEGSVGDTTGLGIAGVYYLKVLNSGTATQKCEWVPLEFKDDTACSLEYIDGSTDDYKNKSNSFTKSGMISFDMPLDWDTIKMEELYGGIVTKSGGSTVNPINVANTATDSGSALGTTLIENVTFKTGSTYTKLGLSVKFTGSNIGTALSGMTTDLEEYEPYRYIIEVVDGVSTGKTLSKQNLWAAKITGNTWGDYANCWSGGNELFAHFGEESGSNYTQIADGTVCQIILKRINFYEVFPGNFKIGKLDGGSIGIPVDAGVASAFPNTYGFKDYSANSVADELKSAWSGSSKYPLMITLSGTTAEAGSPPTDKYTPEIWNMFDATQGYTGIVKEIDDSAYNLNSLAITSDLSIGRRANYFKAITRKGKTFVVKTGVGLTSVGFSSVALGDEKSSSAFDDHGPSSLYGHLHKLRNIQSDSVSVYWDEPQKDGTFIRFWGKVTDLTETRGVGGPRAIMNFSFNMTITEIALLDSDGAMMTDIYPLGGIQNERNYS